MTTELIINADDFGLAKCVTEGIEAAHVNGIVTRTSLLTVGQAFEIACEVAKRNPKLGIGVHLCLDEERPVSPTERVSTLVTDEGYFFLRSQLIKRLLFGRIDLNQVRNEWQGQIEKALNKGLSLTHLDSHGHVHCWPTLLPIALELAAKYKVKYLRVPIEATTLGWTAKNAGIALCYQVGLLLAKQNNFVPTSADYFLGLKFGGCLNETNLLTLLRRVSKPARYEIMCHPGYYNKEELKRWLYWKYNWEEELKALQLSRVKDLILEVKTNLKSMANR